MQFNNYEHAKQFERDNFSLLNQLHKDACAVQGVVWSETWLNGKAPSFVAGYDADDEMVVCFPITHAVLLNNGLCRLK